MREPVFFFLTRDNISLYAAFISVHDITLNFLFRETALSKSSGSRASKHFPVQWRHWKATVRISWTAHSIKTFQLFVMHLWAAPVYFQQKSIQLIRKWVLYILAKWVSYMWWGMMKCLHTLQCRDIHFYCQHVHNHSRVSRTTSLEMPLAIHCLRPPQIQRSTKCSDLPSF